MTAYVIVQPATGRDNAALLAHPEVRALLAAHDARALPSPAATRAGSLAVPLTLAVPDMTRATRLAAALRAQAGVGTAYAKPAEAAP